MREFIAKYWKKIGIGVLCIIALVILYEGISFIYKNTYTNEKYEYSSKVFQNQTFDQNVRIIKNVKRNGSAGEFSIVFDKKDLTEEYQIALDKDLVFSNIEVSAIGKISAGELNVRMVDENNIDVFNKVVKGLNIKEVSRTDSGSKSYKLIFIPNGAQNGDLEIKFKLK